MFDAGIGLALLGLLGAKAEGSTRAKHKRRAAVEQLGEHAKDSRDELDRLRARLKRGADKLEAVSRDLANARHRAGRTSAIDRRLAHDLRTEPAKLADVLEHAAGLARDKRGRWRLVERGPSKPAKPEPKHDAPAHDEPATPKRPKRRGISAHAAAVELRDYLATPGANWGWQGKPSPSIELRQRQMRGVKADGMMGRGTRARALELGVTLPARPRAAGRAPLPKTPTAPTAPSSTRATTTTDDDRETRRRLRRHHAAMIAARKRRAARRAAARAGTAAPAPAPVRSPEAAARELRDYLATAGANWGWQGTPSPTIALAQHDMGGDTGTAGLMGLKTRARARALGVTLPSGPR